jgi:hypothetical protein
MRQRMERPQPITGRTNNCLHLQQQRRERRQRGLRRGRITASAVAVVAVVGSGAYAAGRVHRGDCLAQSPGALISRPRCDLGAPPWSAPPSSGPVGFSPRGSDAGTDSPAGHAGDAPGRRHGHGHMHLGRWWPDVHDRGVGDQRWSEHGLQRADVRHPGAHHRGRRRAGRRRGLGGRLPGCPGTGPFHDGTQVVLQTKLAGTLKAKIEAPGSPFDAFAKG